MLQEGGVTIAVDFGATSLQALRALGMDPASIDAVFLTHLHGDHILGLPFLVIDGMYYSPRGKTLQIHGPIRARERFELLMRAAYEDILHLPRNFNIEINEWAPGSRVRLLGFNIVTFPADHMDPPHAPLMLRIETPSGKIVSFSGDTTFCEALAPCADGADLLVSECTGLHPPMGRHSTWRDWKSNIHKIRAKRIVLSHLGAPVREASQSLLKELNRENIQFADDGLIVTL